MSEYFIPFIGMVVGVIGFTFLLHKLVKTWWIKYIPSIITFLIAVITYNIGMMSSYPEELPYKIASALSIETTAISLFITIMIDIVRKYKKHIPNTITTIRFILAVLFPFVFFINRNTAVTIFIVASISDSIDGFLARRWNVVSDYGKRIDPIADKLLGGLAIILSSIFISNLMLVLLFFELIIVYLGIVDYKRDHNFNVDKWGKVKTVFLLATVSLTLLTNFQGSLVPYIIGLIVITSILQIVTIKAYAVKKVKDEV